TLTSDRRSLPFTFIYTALITALLSTLSLHDALPIYPAGVAAARPARLSVDVSEARHGGAAGGGHRADAPADQDAGGNGVHRRHRSEEHTSELQSRGHLVCRLLLEKKNTNTHSPVPQG